MNKAVFLDRDNTLNELIKRLDGSLTSPWQMSELKLLPYVEEALKKMKDFGYLLFIVSNQPEILYERSYEDLLEIDEYFLSLGIDDSRYAFIKDMPDYKPGNASIEWLIRQYNIDRNISYMIGDRFKDIVAGKRSGLYSIFLGKYYTCPKEFDVKELQPDAICDNILESISFIKKD